MSRIADALEREAEAALTKKVREASIELCRLDARAAGTGSLSSSGYAIVLCSEIEKQGRELQAFLLEHYDRFSGRPLVDRARLQKIIADTRRRFLGSFSDRLAGSRPFGGSIEAIFKAQLGAVAGHLEADADIHFHGVAALLADQSRQAALLKGIFAPLRWAGSAARALVKA